MTVQPIGFNKKYVCVFINVTRSRVTFKTPNEMARAVEISAFNLPVLLLLTWLNVRLSFTASQM